MSTHEMITTHHETLDGNEIAIRWSVYEDDSDCREVTLLTSSGSLALSPEDAPRLTGLTWRELQDALGDHLQSLEHESELNSFER